MQVSVFGVERVDPLVVKNIKLVGSQICDFCAGGAVKAVDAVVGCEVNL